ncbi:MAG: recombinase family protein [Gemmatimonadota bacterium]|nr:recombinase family protein [Gemmatimonadota bacterium]
MPNPTALERQLQSAIDAAERDGFTIPDDESFRFADIGAGGLTLDRPGWNRLMDIAAGDAPPPFRRVYVQDPARLSRAPDSAPIVLAVRELERRGVVVRFCTDCSEVVDASAAVRADDMADRFRSFQARAQARFRRR